MTGSNPHPIDVEVGGRVRLLRTAQGMNQTTLGQRCGVSFQQVQKYETGVNRMSASRLCQVAAALGVTPASLFDGIEAETPPSTDRVARTKRRQQVTMARALAARLGYRLVAIDGGRAAA